MISVSNAIIIHSKQQSADTGIVIGRYRLSADYWCIPKSDINKTKCNCY